MIMDSSPVVLLTGAVLLIGVVVGTLALSPTSGMALFGILAIACYIGWAHYRWRFSVTDLAVTGILAYAIVLRSQPFVMAGVKPLVPAVVAVLVANWLTRRPDIGTRDTLPTWGSCLLLVGALLSLSGSADTSETVWQMVYGLALPMLFYSAVGRAELADAKVTHWLTVVIFATWLPFGRGLLEFYHSFGIPSDMQQLITAHFDIGRIGPYQQATFGNVLHAADLLLLLIPPTAVLFKEAKGFRRVAFGLTLVLYMCNLVIVASRSATIILLAVGALGVLAVSKRAAKWRVLMLAVIVGGAAVLLNSGATLDPVADRFRALYEGDISTSGRLEAMKLATELFMKHPLAGVGLGAYRLQEPVYTAAHNMVLHLAAETGGLGLLGALILFLYPIIKASSILKSAHSSPIVMGCWLGLLAFAGQAVVAGSNFSGAGTNVWGMLFWFYLCVCTRPTERTEPSNVCPTPAAG